MEDVAVFERLRSAREARGETRPALARRIGVGERLLKAIDEGRPGDLPSGLYARAAIRRYAQAMGIDPDEALAACAAELPSGEDPLAALARLQGLRPAAAPQPAARQAAKPAAPILAAPAPPPDPRAGMGAPFPAWRPLAALAADGIVIAALLVLAVGAAVPLSGSLPSALGRPAAPVFGLLGLVLAVCYFLFFGGVACATAGERLIGMRVGRRHPRHMNPTMVAVRAARCWARDVRYLQRLGEWAGKEFWSGAADGREARTLGEVAGR